MNGLLTETFTTVPGYPSLPINPAKAVLVVETLMHDGVGYGLGAKPRDLAAAPPSFVLPDGRPCHAVDCSGLFRYMVYQATAGRVTFVDGSVNQHAQAASAGFKETDPANCGLHDGHFRVVFLSPGYEGVGHVCAFHGGSSLESHGGRGPDRRPWGSCAWMRATEYLTCYVLA